MRRYLVVAHQTALSVELLEALLGRARDDRSSFHIVVPMFHGSGLVWTDGESRAQAHLQLDRALVHFRTNGLDVSGEVGDANPIYAVAEVIDRQPAVSYNEIVVSTLPKGMSRWLRLDIARRLAKTTRLPVHHVVSALVDA